MTTEKRKLSVVSTTTTTRRPRSSKTHSTLTSTSNSQPNPNLTSNSPSNSNTISRNNPTSQICHAIFRNPSSTPRPRSSQPQLVGDHQNHLPCSVETTSPIIDNQNEIDQLDLLQVVDPAARTASTLTHIQNSLFVPSMINKFGSPVLDLQQDSSTEPCSSIRIKSLSPTISKRSGIPRIPSFSNLDPSDHHQADPSSEYPSHEPQTPSQDPLDQHLIHIINDQDKQSRSSKSFRYLRRHIAGARAFLITPFGILFTIYGILVVFWGAALTLILLGWLKIEPKERYRIWVEICSQILNGLFTIPAFGLFPSRVIDWWNVSIILHYARVIWKRKGRKSLEDPNDLIPEQMLKQKEDENQVDCPNDERAPTTHPQQEPSPANPDESSRDSLDDVWKDDQEIVLGPDEITRLRTAQEKLCKSQTWYRPHSSATHYAFPIKWAVVILMLNLGNSLFQAGLCGVMWGLRYSTRPAWTTGTFMGLSFACGLTSALLIWRIGLKTLKSRKVMKEIKEALLKPTKKDKLAPMRTSFNVVERIKKHAVSRHHPPPHAHHQRRKSSTSTPIGNHLHSDHILGSPQTVIQIDELEDERRNLVSVADHHQILEDPAQDDHHPVNL